MKSIPEQKKYIMNLSQAISLAEEIFNENFEDEFDDKCIEKYEIFFAEGIPVEMFIYYNKIKITQNGHVGYWPIHTHKEDYNIAKGLDKLLSR